MMMIIIIIITITITIIIIIIIIIIIMMMMLMRFKKETNRENQKNIISRTVEHQHFENWFVESPQNKPCTSLFIISIMDVPTSI